jgi:hypothetical protein
MNVLLINYLRYLSFYLFVRALTTKNKQNRNEQRATSNEQRKNQLNQSFVHSRANELIESIRNLTEY